MTQNGNAGQIIPDLPRRVPDPAGNNRDPGLQPERTRQAWDRTLFVMMLDAVFFLRIGFINGNLAVTVAGWLLLSLVLGVLMCRRRYPPDGNRGHILSPLS
ncbi:DUF202 domain-containing protein [Acerihabitans sp. KWT182]|uniref:DUF202 domain-containing protein n=1 Tax=Acerihabitans sp. KWT182 TaxID=3157919 RepID=A0AAU7Q612_9GAMM